MWFRRIYPAPLSEPTTSRESTIYLYHGLCAAGITEPRQPVRGFAIWRVIMLGFSIFYLPFAFILNYILNIKQFLPDEMLISLQLAINAFGYSVKVLTVLLSKKRLATAIKAMDTFDARCTSEFEQLKLRENVAIGNKICFVYFILYFIYATMTVVGAYLSGRAPFNIYLPFVDWRAGQTQFVVQTLMEYATVGAAVVQCGAIDSYPVVFVNTLRSHLELLIRRIANLGSDETTEIAARQMELVRCIQDHKAMLGYADLLRPVMGGTIFTQFLVCGSVLGVVVINIMFFSDLASVFGNLFYVVVVLFQTFPLCYFCNCLIDECEVLANAVFHSKWHDADQRYKKTLVYYLQKVQQPISFAAFNIFPISLATNITAAKFAFTVYTLAKKMNLEERFKK